MDLRLDWNHFDTSYYPKTGLCKWKSFISDTSTHLMISLAGVIERICCFQNVSYECHNSGTGNSHLTGSSWWFLWANNWYKEKVKLLSLVILKIEIKIASSQLGGRSWFAWCRNRSSHGTFWMFYKWKVAVEAVSLRPCPWRYFVKL